ncbi:efflux RND transporter periplasmic adaptor subunit [Azospirillum canadense]|uniref:efflux RND transporter periplasmic adaptor subunit n=1 Tax=Azospirillum canadense TaxID=403962 RepID=UPI002227BF91|nr:HlyD family efflux transporter periplasmic adaptor subunit [Azospirillum canadense]MCW2242491.1 multidrug resistance efflux pump [Azospirillum canadense]
MIRYRQAALWRCDGPQGGRLAALSGVPLLDRRAPFAVWLERVLRQVATDQGASTDASGPRRIDAVSLSPELARDWAEWLPAHVVWVPLLGRGPSPLGALVLAREEPWGDAELHLLGYIADAYGHAWQALEGVSRSGIGALFHRRRARAAAFALALAGVAAVLAYPVHQSALAPAEVIARNPTVVRAPIDGVVDRFEVQPNEEVREGQLLLVLDRVRLQNRLDIARKAYEVAEAEHRQAAQQALFDPKSKANLAVLKGRMEQQAAEVAYVDSLLARVEIRAPRAGVAVFDDVNDWIGRPVKIGERILTVADPRDTELEVRLPVAEAIALDPGADVRLFLNIDPQNPVSASLTYAGYQAEPTPDGVLAYRLKARFADDAPPPRIGLKGTAKLYGHDGRVIELLLRRPLASLRQRLGL